MANLAYPKEITALLVIDPYNDFISEGGKLWDRIKTVAEANQCVPNMLKALDAARQAKLRIFYAMHRRYRPGDYENWKYIAPIQKGAWTRKSFEYGTWGGEIRSEFQPKPGEIVAAEHWCSSGFANTDLDLQLKRHGIHQLIVIGLIAHTCIEATVRFAAELGYDVTVVRDATADYTDEMMHAALDINLPNYANAIESTTEVVDLDLRLSKLMGNWIRGDIVSAWIPGLDLCFRTGQVLRKGRLWLNLKVTKARWLPTKAKITKRRCRRSDLAQNGTFASLKARSGIGLCDSAAPFSKEMPSRMLSRFVIVLQA
jgi:ureidoacrylate peracid hydrolase